MREKVLVLQKYQHLPDQIMNERTYDKMPIHVHIITQVRPRIGMEWKFLC